MSLNPTFLHFTHSNLPVSHTPKPNTFTCCNYNSPQTHFLFSIAQWGRFNSFRLRNPKTRSRLASSENDGFGTADSRFKNVIGKPVGFVASILPGGSWWSLSDRPVTDAEEAEPTAAVLALRRMWELVADKGWVVLVAFGSLVVAALSEITMPSILAASIFSAQSGETAVFSRNALLLVLLCVSSGICSGMRSGCFGILNVTLVKRLRENLYAAVLFQDISYFDKVKVGDLTSRLAADCQRLSHVIGNDLHLILRNTLQGTGAIINLLTLSWPLALSALVICSMLSAIFLVYGQYQRKAAKLTQDFTACANEVAHETLSLIRIVRAYGSEKDECRRYKQWLQRLAFINSRESVAYGFWNMSFHTFYRSTQMPVLEHLNFSVDANQVVAIVGLSGSGKSTLLNLLLRLYEPSTGQIYIDGFPLKELDIRWLRQNIGYVAQESHLFHMDIKSNIKYGCPRPIKHEDIERAARQAFAHDFICSLPNGYETLVDDNTLSGGQKQRIAIARAILRDPVIMILDEATSALDSESEHCIKEVLYALKGESSPRTIIIIAHRLSTIKAADRIFVMDNGRIIEMGNHEELLLNDGLYAKLNRIQADIFT